MTVIDGKLKGKIMGIHTFGRWLSIVMASVMALCANANAQSYPSPTFQNVIVSGGIAASLNKGALSYGTLSFSDTNIWESWQTSVNSYAQAVWQNTNGGATASTGLIVANDLGTATTHYGEFGITSSGFTGTGSLNLANAVYLTGTTGDLVLGTTSANAVHFVVNGGATDAMTISSGGAVSIAGWVPSYGALLISAGAPVAAGTGNAIGDKITLATTGGVCTTAPIVSVTAVSGGGVTNFWVQNPGVCSVPPSGTLTQASTTGAGSGATFNLLWGPYTPFAASAGLGAGGGNFFAGGTGNETAGYANVTGVETTYVGVRAGDRATGSYNTAIGMNAFGDGAVAISGYTTPTGAQNTAVGNDSMRNPSGSASRNTSIGFGALGSAAGILLTGVRNTAIGALAGNNITTGTDNFLGGDEVALTTLSTGTFNTIIGGGSFTDSATAGTSSCVSIGTGTKCGSTDTFVGYGAGGASQDNNHNAAFGYQAGLAWTTQVANAAFGYQAGRNTTGVSSLYAGAFAGLNSGSGGRQVFLGWTAGQGITAANVVMVGPEAGRAGTSGCSNGVGIGQGALYACQGANNTAVGNLTLLAVTTGSQITAIGANVGSVTCQSASGVILIGFSAVVDCPAAGTTNWLNIGRAYYATLSAPTISSGFGTSPSVSAGTSSVFFQVNVGTGGVASSGVIGFSTAAPNGWACEVADTTTPATNNTVQTASTTNSVTVTNYSRTTGIAAAWTASDVLTVTCHGG